MKTGHHVGKIFVSFRNGITAQAVPQRVPAAKFSAEGSYLVTGGTKNFGFEVAKWIAAHGAGEVILVSRGGSDTAESKQAVEALKTQGVRVSVYACDVSDKRSVLQLMRQLTTDGDSTTPRHTIKPTKHLPLKGIFHAAVVLEDGFLRDLTAKSFNTVMSAKVLGALWLHQLTAQFDIKLDMFVCLSSISALIANPGQTSYVVANSFLDGLMRRRQSMGLAGTSVNFGAIGGTGILDRKADVRGAFERFGVRAMPIPVACAGMGAVMASGEPQLGVYDVTMAPWKSFIPWTARSGRFAKLIEESLASAGSSQVSVSWRDIISALPVGDRVARAQTDVLEAVSSVLRVAPEALQLTRPVQDIGVDSLTALEIAGKLLTRCDVRVSTVEILRALSITDCRC